LRPGPSRDGRTRHRTLVAELEALASGRALDVGCGEGADAIWLAGQGWQVSALDVSEAALSRARAAACRTCVDVEWIHAGLLKASLGDRVFDLV
jgi:2-polyprenyl-3-methyl-5-hydroxy-6-metoxy-1,4-benzoquinol methylase